MGCWNYYKMSAQRIIVLSLLAVALVHGNAIKEGSDFAE
eukprot:TCALIF_07617-PA protein Name:"Protein of unknown function" AED:0.54 eAED:0.54 QI:0/0/0/0.33/0.5/0.66/3/0/38